MLIKLSYTADKESAYAWRAVVGIVNNSAINSISTLSSTASSGSWDSTILASLDTANSYIIRTNDPVNVKGHTAKLSGTSTVPSETHTFEFSTYDSLSTKYYVQIASPSTSSNGLNCRIGTGLTGGTITSSQLALSAAANTSTAGSIGTALTVTNAYTGDINTSTTTGVLRTLWVYITDTCLIFAASHINSNPLGFNSTYASTASPQYTGPYIISQYTRYDYHNTVANGITPVLFSSFSRVNGASGTVNGVGFGGSVTSLLDWDAVHNIGYVTSEQNPFNVMNLINAAPQNGASFPKISNQKVNWGVGTRMDTQSPITTASAASTGIATTIVQGKGLSTTVSERYPSANLTAATYAMLPLTWEATSLGNYGGNASDKGGFFIFNGDYFAGDEFTYGGKTYIIWPTFVGFTQRVGLAIPKE